jgi:hypothetical protein
MVIVRCKVRRGSLDFPTGFKVRGVGLNFLGASGNADVRIWMAAITAGLVTQPAWKWKSEPRAQVQQPSLAKRCNRAIENIVPP